jgi:hypothetical protein
MGSKTKATPKKSIKERGQYLTKCFTEMAPQIGTSFKTKNITKCLAEMAPK